MAKRADDGRVWGRPEAVDSMGGVPGRRGRSVAGLVGVSGIAVGLYMGIGTFMGSAQGATAPRTPVPPTTTEVAPDPVATCAGVGVDLPRGRFPTEGIPRSSVVRIYRGDELLVAQAFVLESATDEEDGSLSLSVLLRTGQTDDVVAQLSGANVEGSLSMARLYEIEPGPLLQECREG